MGQFEAVCVAKVVDAKKVDAKKGDAKKVGGDGYAGGDSVELVVVVDGRRLLLRTLAPQGQEE